MRRKYKEYDDRIQAQMSAVENHLTEKYGSINRTWNVGLQLLADNLDKYYQCKDRIEQDGVAVQGKFGLTKNPLLSVQKDLEIQITKLLSEYGLTPKSGNKIIDNTDDKEDEDALRKLLLG